MTRVVVGLLGVAATLYGGWLLLAGGHLVEIGLWLAGGVLLHDLLLAPLVVFVCVLVGPWLPEAWRAAAAGALVILGSVTLLAVPVLGGFGARPDNATLLDRNYAVGWLLLAGLTLLAMTAVALASRPARGSARGAGRSRRGPRARG